MLPVKTQYELLADIDRLPYFILALSSKCTSAYRAGCRVTDSMRWASSIYRRWVRARNPKQRKLATVKDLDRYYNETTIERRRRRKSGRASKKVYFEKNKEKINYKNMTRYYENKAKELKEKQLFTLHNRLVKAN